VYSGVIGRVYVSKDGKLSGTLIRQNSEYVELQNSNYKSKPTIEEFQNWIDTYHSMYVRQVGEVTLPFPDENC